ncbi:Gfo/Idh/MocA family protein [Facilibium subflavum]|uniref:Gfo/Idh/MocA family protein n=1 Tax=Facilibium subflavum TaxID=2219058 RepID=UPI000E64CD06|nr:Gfo/Idh/MocA family oxidoreductase [Facilibium subflavum]
MKQVALIGCGRIGKMHYKNLKQIPDIKVKYIVDDYAQPQDYPEALVQKTAQIDVVLSDKTLDACIIAASSSAHIELIEKAVQYKKHVFCEKPISFDVAKLRQLKQKIQDAGIKFQVGLNRRFDPDFLALKKAIDEGVIGQIQMIQITNRDPKRPDLKFVGKSGGLFFDFNTHDFDMVRFLANEEVVEVYAMGEALVEPSLKELNDIDTTLITLKLKSGALVMIDASRETNCGYDQRIEVLGDKGMVLVDNINQTKTSCLSAKTQNQLELPYWSFVERYKEAYLNEFTAFIDYLHDRSSSPVGIDDMIYSVEIATAVQTAYNNKQCVILKHADTSQLAIPA